MAVSLFVIVGFRIFFILLTVRMVAPYGGNRIILQRKDILNLSMKTRRPVNVKSFVPFD